MEEVKRYSLEINTDSLNKIVKKQREELESKINDFCSTQVKFKFDKQGNEINDTNPFLVSTYFFKPINPMGNVDPMYTSEQLNMVYDLYCYIVEQINIKVMTFQPTISHFVKFAGMTLNKFQELKNTYDENMRILVDKINSDIFDANMTLAQHKKITERPTTYRMKVENEFIEKKSPNINVTMSSKHLDLDEMEDRLRQIQRVTSKRITYEGKI